MTVYVFNGGGSVILVQGLGAIDPRDRNWNLFSSIDGVGADLTNTGTNILPIKVQVTNNPLVLNQLSGVLPGSAQFAVGTTAVQVLNSVQNGVCFQNLGATDLFLGGGGVTTGNGVKFPANDATRFTPNQAMKSCSMVGSVAGGTAAVLFY